MDSSLSILRFCKIMKRFGPVQGIKLQLKEGEHSLRCYVVFGSCKYAHDAHIKLDDHCQQLCFKNRVA